MQTYYSIQVAGRTILGEARGESIDTQRGVAFVLCSRLHDGRWGKTLAEVARAPWQFSCWNINDPNRPIIEAFPDDHPPLLIAVGLLGEALGGLPDPTHGAKWYKNAGLAWPKDWGAPRSPICRIGGLEFFNLDGKESGK